MAICRACNGKISLWLGASYLGYSNDSDCEVCDKCFELLEKVIRSPNINSEFEFDAYLNNLDSVLAKLNVPESCFENLKKTLINNKNMIIRINLKDEPKPDEKEEKKAKYTKGDVPMSFLAEFTIDFEYPTPDKIFGKGYISKGSIVEVYGISNINNTEKFVFYYPKVGCFISCPIVYLKPH